ncbi:tetratricopeptide repeat protein [Polaribacter sp. Hel1_85]|uniref:type IX secretion system periplasmic lipoprotein PorW/SprE n=1 Tax=Polaribacter sp. Hel1_85 TaxID=1250005 RepID=UPI00052CE247|nr:tetratricopeptide repeat protein [Polaribacter sp. Hel1_85]KGL62566.1 gliding motility protein SprE [Polaribacter sp. Hel1_85]
MKFTKKIVLILSVFAVIYSCSTKKDTVVSRNWHSLNTKFNVLFNGKEAFKKGIDAINNDYEDDWFQQLPIEPIKFEGEKIDAPKFNTGIGAGFDDEESQEKKASTPFGIAEEKAVKAIQKHGMNIDGIERNSQIDDSYLLLGKARYYDQRFIPAIEAFNYVITNYPFASLINETKIWRAKTNIRLDNEEFAIESMKLLLQVKDTLEVDLPEEIKEHGYTTLAMAYVKTDSLQKVKKYLTKATETLNNSNQGARNLFVLGQIYSSENKKDSASMVFNKIIDFKKAPKKYKMHANIELAKNSTSDSTTVAVLEKLHKLIKERENRPYLDELYYQVGFLHEKNDSINLAIDYYNRSLRAESDNVKQKTFTFERLGNINFKDSKYQLASAYYDSILSISVDSLNLRIRRIKRKHKNLASLINFENIVTENDSIIKIASLSKTDQETYFQKYIDDLKKADKDAAQLKLNQAAFGADFGGNSLQSNKKGKWYFYNPQSLNFGQTEFKKIWGNRKLEDDWRWSSKIETSATEKDSVQVEQVNLRYDLASYLKTIPSTTGAIDTLKLDRNQALYELGLIYKEQFKNPKIAIERLERVASLNPKKELILPINWHLYKIYQDLGEDLKSNKHKNIILTNYPNTIFAKTIKNPNKKIEEDISVNEVENKYRELYYLYKENKFQETVKKVVDILPSIQNSKLIAKFELLRAYAIGKYTNKETYKFALEAIVIKYGNTEEGKQAKKIVEQLSK